LARNIRLILAYDGTEFSGWQVQNNARTVQGDIEEALQRMHDHPVRIQGAGRTDSGVHASGQVGNFFSDLESIEPSRWHIALNSYLPPDVRAMASSEAPETFNAKNSALQRVYRYYLYTGSVGLPHLRLYCWKIRRRPDTRALNALASVFLGEHDFTTFAAAGDASKSKVRRVDTVCFFPEGPFICFKVAASSFVWKMVRSMLGTVLEYEQNGLPPDALAEALRAQDRSQAGMSAPARGLFLEKVNYDEDEGI
jgi:tRNA pseudouridine38-40 synthase